MPPKRAKKTPKDRVGHTIPTPDDVANARAKIADVTAFARALGPQLSKAERASLSRPRKDGDTLASDLTDLARKHNISSRLLSPDAADADFALQNAIRDLTRETFAAWSALRDVYTQARSERWDAALFFYGALSNAAETDPQIFTDLAPVTKAFAIGPRPAKSDAKANDNDDGLE